MKYLIAVIFASCAPHQAAVVLESVPASSPTIVASYAWSGITVRRDHNHDEVASVASVSADGVDFHGVTFTMRLDPIAYGADAYTNIYVNGALWAEVGINGFEHWDRDSCHTPNTADTRFFIGLAAHNETGNPKNSPSWTNDVAVDFPVTRRFDAPTTFTVASDNGRIRFYVQGLEITYRDVGNFFPAGGFDNTSQVKIPLTNSVKVELVVLGDGTNTESCGSVEVPFIPGIGPVDASVVWDNVTIY